MEKCGGSDNILGDNLVASFKNQFDAVLRGVREEFDEHRDSINDNTDEIEANYELLCKLEAKVDKLQEQFEQLQLTLAMGNAPSMPVQSIDLDEKEKEVFLILYTGPSCRPVTYREVASAMKESEFLVRGYITNLIEKGVPIEKRYINEVAYVSLNPSFRERQAKENLVKLSQKTMAEFA